LLHTHCNQVKKQYQVFGDMRDEKKTKQQLIRELNKLRQRLNYEETLRDQDITSADLYKYRSIFESTGTAMIISENDMTISLTNREFEKLSGYSKEEIEGKINWNTFVADKEMLDTMLTYHTVRRIAPPLVPRNYEFNFTDKQGNIKNIMATVAIIAGSSQSIASYLDITERKKNEEALRLDEARLEAQLKLNQMAAGASLQCIVNYALKEGINLTKSKDGYIAFVNENEKTATLYSCSAKGTKECNIKNPSRVFDLDSMGLWGEPIRQRSPIVTNNYTTTNYFKKGYPQDHVPLSRHMGIPLFNNDTIYAIAGVANKSNDYDQSDVRQLTLLMQGMLRLMEHKNNQDRLRESEQRFRDLAENSPTGISIIQNGTTVYSNQEHQRLFGQSDRQTHYVDLEMIYPDDFSKVKQRLRDIASDATDSIDIEFRLLPLDTGSNFRWVHCYGTSIKYDGEAAIMLNMMDVTRNKELDQLMQIQDKMASLGRVAAGIAHEIRNPLSGINIYLNLLEKSHEHGSTPEKVSEIYKQMHSASKKIESVIKRVMDFSKPTEHKLISGNIKKPILDAVELSSVSLRKSKVALDVDVDGNLPDVLLNPQLIEELILNLISNAAEAMSNTEGEKVITIKTACEHDIIVTRIADSGPGIPHNLRDKIFEPFYTTKHDSSGIGLSICQRIVNDHQASITVHDSQWGGTEFIFQIPITQGNETA